MKKISSLIGLLIIINILNAQTINQLAKLTATDRSSGNQFGNAVSISGNFAVVGAGNIAQAQIGNAGNCVYVFERKSDGTWKQVQKLTPKDPEPDDAFGFSVSIGDNYIIIGAPKHDNIIGEYSESKIPDAGAAYIFIRNETGVWIEEKQLSFGVSPGSGDLFGYSVSTDGISFIVGSPGRDYAGKKDCGDAVIFRKLVNEPSNLGPINGWCGCVQFGRYNPVEGEAFGTSVSVDGGYSVVGAPNYSKDESNSNDLPGAGAAYVFTTSYDLGSNKRYPAYALVNPDREAGDQFGKAVSIHGNQIIVGAPYEDEDATGVNRLNAAGSAYIFQLNPGYPYKFSAKLVARDRAVADLFGSSVFINNKYAVVGATAEDENASGTSPLNSAGSVYLFINDHSGYNKPLSGPKNVTSNIADWVGPGEIKLVASDRAVGDWFGYAVAVDDSCILIGAPLHDKNMEGIAANDAGAAYIFQQRNCILTTSSISPSACKIYASPSGKYTWTLPGVYKDTVKNGAGCDSIITINLTFKKVDTSVTVTAKTITANAQQASFMWVDCSTNSIMRNVPTLRSFTPTVSGSYAVHVNQNGCSNVSSCYTIKVAPPIVNHPPVKSDSVSIPKPPDQPVNTTPQSNSVAKEFVETNKLVPKDRQGYENFGYAVAISGDYAVIGANVDDKDINGNNPISDAGSAYIFKKGKDGKWKQVQKIVAADRANGDNFGWSVAINNNHIVVGAIYHDKDLQGNDHGPSSGAAYIFELGDDGVWVQKQKLIANPIESQILFGNSVAIDGNTIAVGCPWYAKDATGKPETNLNGAGAVFVFNKTGGSWVQSQILTPKIRTIDNLGDDLGYSVSICGDLIIAGAQEAKFDANGGNKMEASGAAYIFERTGGSWKEVQKIVPFDRAPHDKFGYSVSISGDNAIIGAWQKTETADPDSRPYTGNAYIFSRKAPPGKVRPDGGVILTPDDGKWKQILKINPEDRRSDDYLGWSVGISGDYAIVSAMKQDTDSLDNLIADGGAVYVFYQDKNGRWSQSGKFVTLDRSQLDNFGHAVAVSGCDIIGGTIVDQEDDKDANALTSAGSAYIFSAADCRNVAPCYRPKVTPDIKTQRENTNPPPKVITDPGPVNTNAPIPKADSVKIESNTDILPNYNTDSLDVVRKSLDNKSCVAMTIQENKVYKECSRPEVFLIYKGRKIYIPTSDALYAMWYHWSDVNVVPDGALDKYTRYDIESASLTPGSLVFPPYQREHFALNGISNAIPVLSQQKEIQIGELRGWLQLNDCPGCGDGADCKIGFEPDTDWALEQGIDLQKIIRIGNIVYGEGVPNSPRLSGRSVVKIPQICHEINSSGKLGILTINTTIPSDWTISGITECKDLKWPFELGGLGSRGQYVRIKGSLVTDDPHDIYAHFGKLVSFAFDYSSVLSGANPDTGMQIFENEWRGSVGDWHPGISPQSGEHYARWTEIHPVDKMEVLPDKPREKAVFGVALCARAFIVPSIPNPFPPANPCEEIEFDMYPIIPRPSSNHELVYEELKGPECYFPLGEKTNGSWVTRYEDHIRVYAKVCGGGLGGSPGRFKAIYRVYWKERSPNELTRFGKFITSTQDTIVYLIEPNAVAPSVVEFNFCLSRGDIGELKRMNLPDGSGSSWNLDIAGDTRIAKESLWAGQVNNGQSITFYKFPNITQSILNVPLSDLKIPAGAKVTFNWVNKAKANVTVTAR